ncbi:MAG: Formamidopyrimidine-DNA glycosylase, partial [uncultured Sphingomonadaceae bacterium]
AGASRSRDNGAGPTPGAGGAAHRGNRGAAGRPSPRVPGRPAPADDRRAGDGDQASGEVRADRHGPGRHDGVPSRHVRAYADRPGDARDPRPPRDRDGGRAARRDERRAAVRVGGPPAHAGGRRMAADRGARAGAAWAGVRRRGPPRADRGPRRADQGDADGSADRRGAGQHLRMRGAQHRGHLARARGWADFTGAAGAAGRCGPRRSRKGDRRGWIDLAGFPRAGWVARRLPRATPGVRARRRVVPVRWRDRAAARGERALDLFVRSMPAL